MAITFCDIPGKGGLCASTAHLEKAPLNFILNNLKLIKVDTSLLIQNYSDRKMFILA